MTETSIALSIALAISVLANVYFCWRGKCDKPLKITFENRTSIDYLWGEDQFGNRTLRQIGMGNDRVDRIRAAKQSIIEELSLIRPVAVDPSNPSKPDA